MYYGKKKKNLSLAEEQGKFSSVSDDQDRDLGQAHWIGSMSRTKTCIPIQVDVTIQQQLDQSSSSKKRKRKKRFQPKVEKKKEKRSWRNFISSFTCQISIQISMHGMYMDLDRFNTIHYSSYTIFFFFFLLFLIFSFNFFFLYFYLSAGIETSLVTFFNYQSQSLISIISTILYLISIHLQIGIIKPLGVKTSPFHLEMPTNSTIFCL